MHSYVWSHDIMRILQFIEARCDCCDIWYRRDGQLSCCAEFLSIGQVDRKATDARINGRHSLQASRSGLRHRFVLSISHGRYDCFVIKRSGQIYRFRPKACRLARRLTCALRLQRGPQAQGKATGAKSRGTRDVLSICSSPIESDRYRTRRYGSCMPRSAAWHHGAHFRKFSGR